MVGQERIHSLGVGDVKEVHGLRLELGIGCQWQRHVPNLNDIPVLGIQMLQHLHVQTNNQVTKVQVPVLKLQDFTWGLR